MAERKQVFDRYIESLGKQHAEAMASAAERYARALEYLAQKCLTNHEPQVVSAVRKEQERFERSKRVEDADRVDEPQALQLYQQAYRKLCDAADESRAQRTRAVVAAYVNELERLKIALTKAGELDLAVVARDEAARIREQYRDKAEEVPAPLNLPREATFDPPPPVVLMPTGLRQKAMLYITCDNRYTVWLNGKRIGAGADWMSPDQYEVTIAEGDLLAIEAEDEGPGTGSAGLFCSLVLRSDNRSWGTDSSWKCMVTKPVNGWQSAPLPVFSDRLSTDTIHPAHRNRKPEFPSHPRLQGSFVWSEKASPTIYIKERIQLRKFDRP